MKDGLRFKNQISRICINTLVLAFAFQAFAFSLDLEKAFLDIYNSNPALIGISPTDPFFLKYAEEVLDASPPPRFAEFVAKINDRNTRSESIAARNAAIKNIKTRPICNQKVVVVGGSIGGLFAAAALKMAGYHVVLFEKRQERTRNIHFAIRQLFLDHAALFSQDLAKDLKENYLANSERMLYRDQTGHNHDFRQSGFRGPDPFQATTCDDLLKSPYSASEPPMHFFQPTRGLGIAKDLEERIYEWLQSVAREDSGRGSLQIIEADAALEKTSTSTDTVNVVYKNGSGSQRIEKPFLVVDFSGAGSQTAKAVGAEYHNTARSTTQIAAVVSGVKGKNSSELRYKWEIDRPGGSSPDLAALSQALTRHSSSGTSTWVVADLTAADLQNLKFNGNSLELSDPATDAAFRNIIARAMGVDASAVEGAEIKGAVEGKPPMKFELQSKVLRAPGVAGSVAKPGLNWIAAGDARGNGHWIAGAGMLLALRDVVHISELATKLHAASVSGRPADPAALIEFNKVVNAEYLRAWALKGIEAFYPFEDAAVVKRNFEEAIVKWSNGDVNAFEQFEQKTVTRSQHPSLCKFKVGARVGGI